MGTAPVSYGSPNASRPQTSACAQDQPVISRGRWFATHDFDFKGIFKISGDNAAHGMGEKKRADFDRASRI